jgi:hypothetical protein
VMDFGIALAVSAAAGGRMTETGLSLGTPHYMSPEQATAEKEITPRSDIYSLACVLYEMLAGQPPHIGGAAQQVIMKIITAQAEPVTTFRKSAPPHVESALAKALEKLPADRFDSAKALSDALGNATFSTGVGRRAVARPGSPTDWRVRTAVPALALSAVLAAVAAWALLTAPEPPGIARYQIELPGDMRLTATNWSPFAVSPDGSKMVYMGETGRLFLKSRDVLDPVEIAGTETAFNPFFSHDGKRVGFFAGVPGSAEIRTVTLSGGPPLTAATGAGAPGAAFGYDGYIYFDASGIGPLRRVRETGGDTEDATVRDSTAGELQHNWPEPLPNGRGLLFVIDRAGPGVNVATTNDIAVLDLATRKHRVLMRGVYARYTTTGHILYVTADGVLMAVPFDQDRMELVGTPVALRDGITVRRGGGGVDLAISRTGTLWYGLGSNAFRLELAWATRDGKFTPASPGWNAEFGYLALSPDGSKVAVSIVDATGEQIWVKSLASADAPASKLTFRGVNQYPKWHPNGNRVLFIATFLPRGNVQSVLSNGTSAAPDTVVKDAARVFVADWSRDGRWVTYERFMNETRRDVAAVRTTGDTAILPIAATQFAERNATVSPDGRWVVYESTTTSRAEIYVKPFQAGAAGLYQVSNSGGRNPKWSRDGREIFYVSGNNELTRVAVGSGTTFTYSDQRTLFPLRGVQDWDVAPGGQRFILVREREARESNRLVVVENFFEELKAKVPR